MKTTGQASKAQTRSKLNVYEDTQSLWTILTEFTT